MRRFEDRAGHFWEAVAGRESWGAFFAIFVPAEQGRQIRQAQLQAGTWGEAERELDDLDPTALLELLGRSAIKDLE